jgi:hypothetical protein
VSLYIVSCLQVVPPNGSERATVLTLKSIPIVVMNEGVKVSSQKRRRRHDLPTPLMGSDWTELATPYETGGGNGNAPESPMSSTGAKGSVVLDVVLSIPHELVVLTFDEKVVVGVAPSARCHGCLSVFGRWLRVREELS